MKLDPKPYTLDPKSGFIALMSAIIISVLLLAITVSLGFAGFFTRFNILDSESKERSMALAEGCVDMAVLKLTQDPYYNPVNEVVTIGGQQCTIVSLAIFGNQIIIRTQAVVNKAYTNLVVTVDDDFAIISWQELPN